MVGWFYQVEEEPKKKRKEKAYGSLIDAGDPRTVAGRNGQEVLDPLS